MENNHAKILAVAGKGGVGKTSLAAAIVRQITIEHPDKKILAIDADPAVGLATALGITVNDTIDDIRKEVVSTVKDGETKAAIELLGEARYRIFDAIVEDNGFAFIAVGRPESAGCYCKINSYLKDVISILSENFDYVVIDGEAGIEQINRRVMEKVTHMLLVTDASRKGMDVLKTIKSVADELVMYDKIGAIVNRMPDMTIKNMMDTGDVEILSFIGIDTALAEFDLNGENVFFLPEDSEIVRGTREVLKKLEI